ncbi:MAG: serine/threonine protein kinase [Deltaproteobacteria bacterium]|nr:serine/threonine protein kinase [Deltaproteobacteria bacterium]
MAIIGDIGAGNSLGRYELLMPVASGGMAVVWAARLQGTRGFSKIVAIKTMRPEMVEDPQFEQMFLDEASLASRIRHPHVVEILDLGDEKGVLFLVMEWIDGEPLHVLLKEASTKGGIPLPIATRIGMQVCAGLHAAHELRDDSGKLVGLVHRDVSPQNVLVTWDGVAKVVDFGVAKALGRGAGETSAGQVKGKTAWMAPEQARGGAIDRRSDVFAIGSLLYTMTTGRHPFRRETDIATMLNICSEDRAYRPGKLVLGYPPQLEKALMQALEKDPAKRFPTANDFLKALDHALPSNMRVSSDEETAQWVRGLVAERFEKRREKLKEALRISDERTAGAAQKAKEITNSKMLPLSEASGSGTRAPVTGPANPPEVERWSVTDSNPDSGEVASGGAPESRSGAAVLMPPEMSSISQSAGRKPTRLTAMVVGILAVAAVIGVVAFLRMGGKNDQAVAASPPSATSARSTPAPEPSASAAPAASASASSTPPESSAVASAEPTPSAKGPAAKTPGGKSTAGTKATSTATAAAVPTSTVVPQIRNPGF